MLCGRVGAATMEGRMADDDKKDDAVIVTNFQFERRHGLIGPPASDAELAAERALRKDKLQADLDYSMRNSDRVIAAGNAVELLIRRFADFTDRTAVAAVSSMDPVPDPSLEEICTMVEEASRRGVDIPASAWLLAVVFFKARQEEIAEMMLL